MKTTLCWLCNHEYSITAPECPSCGAINGNVNAAKALEQMANASALDDEQGLEYFDRYIAGDRK